MKRCGVERRGSLLLAALELLAVLVVLVVLLLLLLLLSKLQGWPGWPDYPTRSSVTQPALACAPNGRLQLLNVHFHPL